MLNAVPIWYGNPYPTENQPTPGRKVNEPMNLSRLHFWSMHHRRLPPLSQINREERRFFQVMQNHFMIDNTHPAI